jgi:hypothetical protein
VLVDAAQLVGDAEHTGGLFYDWVHPTPKGADIIGRALLNGLAQAGVIPSSPQYFRPVPTPQADSDEGVLRAVRSWLQWACVRQHDPSVRLRAAESLLESLGPDTTAAVNTERQALLKVVSSWGAQTDDVSAEYRDRLSQLHPCLEAQL